MDKPKVDIASLRWLDAIDRYIRQYDIRGRTLPEAASDVLDGWAIRDELDDLVRRRLLTVVRYRAFERDLPPSCLCGSDWSVHLTPRAIQTFWPKRGGEI